MRALDRSCFERVDRGFSRCPGLYQTIFIMAGISTLYGAIPALQLDARRPAIPNKMTNEQTKPERSESAKVLARLISRLQAMGFTTDSAIPVDAIDWVSDAVNEVVDQHLGLGDMHCKVIYSRSEDGFWCNKEGWSRGTPTFFFDETVDLPNVQDAQLLEWNAETKKLLADH